MPVRKVGHASLHRPHSVHVNASSPSFQLKSRAVRTPIFMSPASLPLMIASRSTAGTRLAGPPRRKKSAGSAVTMWKCSPTGRITRKLSTVSIWIQYDAWYPAASWSGDSPENIRAIASPAKANDRSCAIPGSAGTLSAKRKPSNSEIGDHDRRDQRQDHQRLAVALEPGGLLHEPPPERVADRGKHRKLDEILEAREHPAREPGIDEGLVVTDREKLHFAHEQRHESEEDHRVHQAGLPFRARPCATAESR